MICPHCNKPVPYPYAEARKKARKKWRQSLKGKAWDKARRYERYIRDLIRKGIDEAKNN